jgi:uncharacterized Ntn-hydrolase superfamily protein
MDTLLASAAAVVIDAALDEEAPDKIADLRCYTKKNPIVSLERLLGVIIEGKKCVGI